MNGRADTAQGSAGVLLAIASLSFGLLGFQISIMRLLSYTQWYHFASTTISIALLGFGAAGTTLSILGAAVFRWGRGIVVWASLACPVLIALLPTVLTWLPVDPFLLLTDMESVVRLALLIGFLVLPFLAGAMVIGLSFQLFPESIGRLYAANLVGSAAGTIGAIALLEVVDPGQLPPVLAVLVLSGVWMLVWRHKPKRAPAIAAAAMAALLLVRGAPDLPMSQFKPLSRALLLEGSRVSNRATGPLGVLETVEGPALRYAPGVSLSFTGAIPSQETVFQDGEWIGSLIEANDSVAWSVYHHSITAFPYWLRTPERVLVIAAGTGSDLLYARTLGSASVTGVEVNPNLVRMFTARQMGERAGDALPDTAVTMVCNEGRSFLQRDTSTYDLIVLPILEGQTASAAGTHALFENYLLTVEAFSLCIRRLGEDGIFVVHTWMDMPPRRSVKALATMIEALRANDIQDPVAHLAGLRSWNTAVFAASRKPLTNEDRNRVRRFSQQMAFDLVCLPGMLEDEANRFHTLDRPYLFEAGNALMGRDRENFLNAYPFRVGPATDDRPYFSNFISWGDLDRVLAAYPSGQVPYLELGTFFLAVTSVLVGLLSLLLVGIPVALARRSPSPQGTTGRTLVYFGALGLGYMVTEMVLIQKTILFLGDPIYAVALVVAALLASSSAGSFSSPLFDKITKRRAWLLPAILLGLLTLYLLALSPLMSASLSLGIWARRFLVPIALLPLGFIIGVPFPLGLSRLAQGCPAVIPLAWGVNGCTSVLAASTAVLASMELGFDVLQLLGIGAYAVALCAVPRATGLSDNRQS